MTKRNLLRIPAVLILLTVLLAISAGTVSAKLNATDYEWKKGPYSGDRAVIKVGNDSPALISVSLPGSEKLIPVFKFLYGVPVTNNSAVKGITYDQSTNTLTLDNFRNGNAILYADMMGDDFTIRVIGECLVQSIEVSTREYLGEKNEPLYWGGSLHITGAGTLTVRNTSANYDLWGITLWGEGSDARLKISKTVSLHVYGHVNSPAATREDYFSVPNAIVIIRSAGFYDKDAVTIDDKPITQVYPAYTVKGFMNESEPTLKDYWVNAEEVNIKGTGPVNLATANVSLSATSLPYNGNVQKPDIKINGAVMKEGVDYSAAWSAASSKNAGTYTVTITGKNDYKGTRKLSYKIVKAANPLKVKGLTATVKYSKVKKKAQIIAVSKVLSFAGKGAGKMTYRKVGGTNKITVDKKSGKITVKKGLKKGTYKIKVKIKAGGNSNYKASAVKTVLFRIKVN